MNASTRTFLPPALRPSGWLLSRRHQAACSRLVFAWLVLTAFAGCASQSPIDDHKRGACVVKFASAKEVAAVLSRQFKGHADIDASPDGAGNVLLVSAPTAAVFNEVMKTLEQLDVRPRPVTIDVFIVELPRKAEGKESRPDTNEFSGTTQEVAQRLENMTKNGQAESVKRIQLSTLDGQLGTINSNATTPIPTAATARPNGGTLRTITYQSTGTLLKVTPHIAGDGTITLEVDVEDSWCRNSPTATLGTDEKGTPIPAVEIVRRSLAAKVSVQPGMATLAKDAKDREGEAIIVVGARLGEVK